MTLLEERAKLKGKNYYSNPGGDEEVTLTGHKEATREMLREYIVRDMIAD